MAYLNKAMLIGNIGKDPTVTSPNGKKCVRFSLGVLANRSVMASKLSPSGCGSIGVVSYTSVKLAAPIGLKPPQGIEP